MPDSPDETNTPKNPFAQAQGVAEADAPDAAEDLLPVLPKGDALFDNIPTRAVVLEELAPALGDGALVVQRAGEVGVVLIRERTLFETYCFSPDYRLYGKAAMDTMKSWQDATVSAYRLEPELVDVCPSLLRGASLYTDLRLGWTDWNQLLADLATRDGNFVVEVRTPKGRGVTCITNGKQIATFTEAHPELGPPSLLDALAASRTGSIHVHCEPTILDEEEWAAAQEAAAAPAAAAAAPAPALAPVAEAAPNFEDVLVADMEAEEAGDDAEVPNPFAQPPIPVSERAPAAPDPDEMVEDDAAEPVNPFAGIVSQAPGNGAPMAAAPAAEDNPFASVFGGPARGPSSQGEVTVSEVLDELKTIARNRLARSAARVESMLDDAAAADKPLDDVLEEIRGLVIRGVMQSTLDEVVDEMRNLASSHAA